MTGHCQDRGSDLARGDVHELAFCRLMIEWNVPLLGAHRRTVRHLGLPIQLLPDTAYFDVAVEWIFGPAAHEIKGKKPHTNGCYGLEDNRLAALVSMFDTGEYTAVFYTIFDTARSEWLTAHVADLRATGKRARFPSYGAWTRGSVVDGWYWPVSRWCSLRKLFP